MLPLDKQTARALETAPKLVVATVALMQELTRVLLAEIDIVTKRKMEEHADLLKRKQRLAMDYRSNMKSLAGHPEFFKKLSAEAKAVVKEASKKLAEAVDANARMLRAAVDATRKLVQNVMSVVKAQAIPQQTYKNLAKAHLQLGTYSPKCHPIAVCRSV